MNRVQVRWVLFRLYLLDARMAFKHKVRHGLNVLLGEEHYLLQEPLEEPYTFTRCDGIDVTLQSVRFVYGRQRWSFNRKKGIALNVDGVQTLFTDPEEYDDAIHRLRMLVRRSGGLIKFAE